MLAEIHRFVNWIRVATHMPAPGATMPTTFSGSSTWSATDPYTRSLSTIVDCFVTPLSMPSARPTDHVFLYRNRMLRKDLVRERIKAAGRRAGVKVTPHRLRHTCATQLLNAGCRVTSIQKLLGHRRLNSTMIYARAHDRTVAEDYYAAMAWIEDNLDISPASRTDPDAGPTASDGERDDLLALLDRLAAPQVSVETRLELVEQVRHLVIQ